MNIDLLIPKTMTKLAPKERYPPQWQNTTARKQHNVGRRVVCGLIALGSVLFLSYRQPLQLFPGSSGRPWESIELHKEAGFQWRQVPCYQLLINSEALAHIDRSRRLRSLSIMTASMASSARALRSPWTTGVLTEKVARWLWPSPGFLQKFPSQILDMVARF